MSAPASHLKLNRTYISRQECESIMVYDNKSKSELLIEDVKYYENVGDVIKEIRNPNTKKPLFVCESKLFGVGQSPLSKGSQKILALVYVKQAKLAAFDYKNKFDLVGFKAYLDQNNFHDITAELTPRYFEHIELTDSKIIVSSENSEFHCVFDRDDLLGVQVSNVAQVEKKSCVFSLNLNIDEVQEQLQNLLLFGFEVDQRKDESFKLVFPKNKDFTFSPNRSDYVKKIFYKERQIVLIDEFDHKINPLNLDDLKKFVIEPIELEFKQQLQDKGFSGVALLLENVRVESLPNIISQPIRKLILKRKIELKDALTLLPSQRKNLETAAQLIEKNILNYSEVVDFSEEQRATVLENPTIVKYLRTKQMTLQQALSIAGDVEKLRKLEEKELQQYIDLGILSVEQIMAFEEQGLENLRTYQSDFSRKFHELYDARAGVFGGTVGKLSGTLKNNFDQITAIKIARSSKGNAARETLGKMGLPFELIKAPDSF